MRYKYLGFEPGGRCLVYFTQSQSAVDRRNRMLDHLLARQGEETVTWSQELHRWAQKDLTEALMGVDLPPNELLARMEVRRQAVNARLIRDKAEFLAAVPNLNATKLQAFGNPLRGHPEWLQVESTSSGFHWVLVLNGEQRLRSVKSFSTAAAAIIDAEEAVVLAAQSSFYEEVSAGAGRHRYQLKDGVDASAREVGESLRTWTTESAAHNAGSATAALFATLRMEETSMMPMERRIAYLTGIRSQVRRRLCVPIEDFLEIYDEVDSDNIIQKRWRLWELTDYTGDVLLSSVYHFKGPTHAEAVTRTKRSIQSVIRYGLDQWNYQVSPAGPDTFNFELLNPNGEKLGLRFPPLPSEAEAQAAINKTIGHLYSLYSAEGFHTVEHLLLRPRYEGDAFLQLPSDRPESVWERDPYSQRLSLIFPSGYGRDFSPDASDPETKHEVPPHRFRDPEFRRHWVIGKSHGI